MQPADDRVKNDIRPEQVGNDTLFPRQGLMDRVRTVAERITQRVQKVLRKEPDGAPPGQGDTPPSFA